MNRQQMQICNKAIVGLCTTLLLVSTVLTPVASIAGEDGGTWYQGGAATNQTSKGMQKWQKNVTKVLAWYGLISSTVGLILHVAAGQKWFNLDALNIAADLWNLDAAKHKSSELSKEPPPLQAAVRKISGGAEDLAGECEPNEYKTCNEMNAVMDHTEVHVQTLQNAGLEALQDVAGGVLIEPEQLVAATDVIQTGFCMPNVFATEGSGSTASGGTNNNNKNANPSEQNEAEKTKCTKRREAHLQMVATAGVARADLGDSVSKTEEKANSRLASYAGSGDGIAANIKVLAGLDLTFAQRLNLINMLQGQQVANEAAVALHELEGLEEE